MRIFTSAAILALFAATTAVVATSIAQPSASLAPDVAQFAADGSALLPVGYRQWTHIGTRFKPIGVNILDGKVTKTPEIFNAYVEPKALAVFESTGRWPEGARIVKEFSAVQVGANCNTTTFICDTGLGPGIFESGYMGLGMMVKDSKRFPESPGHWGYFSFGHQPPPYEARAQFNGKCVGCHVSLASDTDYVISKAHIGLAGAGRN